LRWPSGKTVHQVCQRDGGIARANHGEFQRHNAARALRLDLVFGGKPSDSDTTRGGFIHPKEFEAAPNVFWEESTRVL
jgi:hypothetical protein